MKAIALVPGTKNLGLVDRQEPVIHGRDEVKMKVLQVGICGTDREEASGGRAEAPPGRKELIIGHEMLGRVVEVGPAVETVRPGDLAVFTVRRGCSRCSYCQLDRSDMCSSGGYTERGIKGQDGYQAEFAVDRESFLVKIPETLASVGVLAEPMSVVEKAIDEALLIQTARLPGAGDPASWLRGKKALVAGIGTIGLLSAFALRLRGAEVFGLGRQDPHTVRPSILAGMGATYLDENQFQPDDWGERFGPMDLILEATGAARLEFDLLSLLGTNGLYALTGIPGEALPFKVNGAAIMRRLVLSNQAVVGSVNAGRKHFQAAVEDLEQVQRTWGNGLQRMVTHRFPYQRFTEAIELHSPEEIKTVVEWAS